LTQDLLQDIGGQNVVKTVCVEAWGRAQRNKGRFNEPAEQTAFAVSDTAKNKGDIQIAAGIIGYADLMEGDGVARAIEAHIPCTGTRQRFFLRFIRDRNVMHFSLGQRPKFTGWSDGSDTESE